MYAWQTTPAAGAKMAAYHGIVCLMQKLFLVFFVEII
jgi:hypothetical protein